MFYTIKELKQQQHISRTLLKWMMSYLSVMIIPLLVCSIYYSHVYSVIKNDALIRQHQSLVNVKTHIDNNLNDLIRISTNLQMNDLVTSAANKSDDANDLHMQLNELMGDLSIYMVTNSFINEIYVYFPTNGYIVSSGTSYQIQYTDYMPSRYISSMTWAMLMSKVEKGSYVFGLADLDSKLIFAKSLVYNHRQDTPSALIVVDVNVEAYKALLENQLSSNSFTSLMLLNDNAAMISTDTELSNSLINAGLQESETLLSSSDTNQSYKVDRIDMSFDGLQLLSLTELSQYNTELSNMLLILFLSLLISIILGSILTFYFSFKNYRPLNDIMGYLKTLPLDQEDKNEYRNIKKAIMQSGREMKTYQLSQKNSYLYKLLTGEVLFSQVTSSVNAQLQLGLSDECNCIILLTMSHEKNASYAESFSNERLPQGDLLFFITQNILTEIFESTNPHMNFCYRDNQITLIISDNQETIDTQSITDGLQTFADYCQQHFNTQFYISISELVDGHHLPVGYKQALNTLEYMHLFESTNILHYCDISRESNIGNLDLKNTEYLINLVMTGNKEQLHQYFQSLHESFSSHSLSAEDAKSCQYFFYNVSMRLKTQLERTLSYRSSASIWPVDSDYFKYSLNEGLNQVESIYIAAIELILNQSNNSSDKKVQDVLQYIDNNFFDMNLNLNNIADHFNISPSYLSKRFKEDTGVQIIDYLYKIRIDHSLLLIEDSSLKVRDIAQMIGFPNSNAFIRIFKKLKGCTPGQYKKSQGSV